jgi:hypothetical protein
MQYSPRLMDVYILPIRSIVRNPPCLSRAVRIFHQGVAAGVPPQCPNSAVVTAEHGGVVVDVHIFLVLGAGWSLANSFKHPAIAGIFYVGLKKRGRDGMREGGRGA